MRMIDHYYWMAPDILLKRAHVLWPYSDWRYHRTQRDK